MSGTGQFFFLFIHYSRATYLDHGGDMYSPFPVRCPRSGGSLQAPPFALRPGLSRERVVRTKEITKEKRYWPVRQWSDFNW